MFSSLEPQKPKVFQCFRASSLKNLRFFNVFEPRAPLDLHISVTFALSWESMKSTRDSNTLELDIGISKYWLSLILEYLSNDGSTYLSYLGLILRSHGNLNNAFIDTSKSASRHSYRLYLSSISARLAQHIYHTFASP